MKLRHKKMARAAYRSMRWGATVDENGWTWDPEPKWVIVRWELKFRSIR